MNTKTMEHFLAECVTLNKHSKDKYQKPKKTSRYSVYTHNQPQEWESVSGKVSHGLVLLLIS